MAFINLDQAVARLRKGETVAVPTETVYGLAARIDNEDALRRIFAIKRRPFFDPLIVHVASVEQARLLTTEWPEIYDRLAKEFWPGPLTLITKKSERVSPLITSGLETVAIRCPRHPMAQKILIELNVPFAAPSANLFGRTSPTRAIDVETEFSGEVAVLDGGACEIGLESTVLAVEDNVLKIFRPGGISRSELRRFLDRHALTYNLVRVESSASPGHLKHHYQPESPVVFLRGREWSDDLGRELGINNPQFLTLPDRPEEAARLLYSEFRRLSQNSKHPIVLTCQSHQHGEQWEAIWDRVERAATHIIS